VPNLIYFKTGGADNFFSTFQNFTRLMYFSPVPVWFLPDDFNRITVNTHKILCAKNKSKLTWNLINKTIKNRTVTCNIKLLVNDNLLVNYDLIVNSFLDVFLPSTTDCDNVVSTEPLTYSSHQMFLTPTDPIEVRSIILGLLNSNSVGPDGIPTRVIKACVDIISGPLSEEINNISLTGTFPEQFKLAKIIPLHKKGSKLDPLNYMPLVIQNIFSKIIEKVFTVKDWLIFL
jgi:hypothetical protein